MTTKSIFQKFCNGLAGNHRLKRRKLQLQIILLLSVFGMLFSGYLSYWELFGTCELGCSASGGIFGLPACVYGFVMYAIITALAWLALNAKK